MNGKNLSRREFIKYAAATGAMFGGGSSFLSIADAAQTAPGEPIPPMTMTYYGNWQEFVEFFKKFAIDLRKIGLNPKLNPLHSSTAVAKTFQHDYGQISSIHWSAPPYRLDPSYFLMDLLHSGRTKKGGRNYGHYRSKKYDVAAEAQMREMDRNKRQKLVWNAQAIAAPDYPIWYIAYSLVVSAYNQNTFGNAVEMIGNGYGGYYTMWPYLKMTPKTDRKTIRSGIMADLDTLNPFTGNTAPTQTWIRYIYDTFAQIGPDLKPHPWAAESWKQISPTVVDVKLREGMKWHDGRPVTGEDVRFTWDYIKKWQFPTFRRVTDVVDNIEIKDWNIRFNLKEPYAPFYFITLPWLFIIPKHIWEKVPQEVGVQDPGKWLNPKPVGSGPFKFVHWRKGQEFYFTANREHFAAPALEGVYFVLIPSVDGLAGALEKGEIDITCYPINYILGKKLEEDPRFKVAYTPSHGIYETRPDCDQKPFNDVNFRKAIYHALDRRPIINYQGGKVIEGRNTPITPVNKFWHNPNLPAPEYDLNKAKEVLKKAGYTWNSQGQLCMPK